ncbi:MAG: hypothetical protein AAGC57_20320 [Pseudomonadota bacterium]
MSSGGNRKSMDDVLSSIRRIIGSDKKDGADGAVPDGAEDQPMALGTPIGQGRAGADAAEDDSALPLTPNMRVDFSKLTDDNPLSGAGREPREPSLPPKPEPPRPADPMELPRASATPPPPPRADDPEDDEAVVIDEAALEDMIRRIVREELNARGGDEAMRQVVRDELMGETGMNISRNVQSLIQAEVSRLLRERD